MSRPLAPPSREFHQLSSIWTLATQHLRPTTWLADHLALHRSDRQAHPVVGWQVATITVRQIQIQILIQTAFNRHLTTESSIPKVSLRLWHLMQVTNSWWLGVSSGGSGQLHHHHPSNSGGGGTKTTGASGMVGQGINGGTIGNQLRNGLNPTLRGYSPSRPRWKVATAPGNNNNY